MKKILYITIGLLAAQASHAQALFYNNGADVHVSDGAFMIVKTGSVQNAAGTITTNGTVVVEGNVQNDATITASGDTIRLTGDWINNGAYAGASASTVDFFGGAQSLTGTQKTVFVNANLLGGNTVKTQTIDQEVSGILNLSNAELATADFEMLVSNNSTTAVQRQAGFVSSLNQGRLSRRTNATAAYFFPTASPSSLGTPLYRPVEFRPSSATASIYGVRTIKGDATLDGFDVTLFDDSLCKVNPNFYHHLHQTLGNNPASITMFYDQSTDGGWNTQAHWDNTRWADMANNSIGSGQGFTTTTVSTWNNFTPIQFALANKKFTIDAGDDVLLAEGETGQFQPIILNVVGPTYEWSPPTYLACTDCPTPDVTPSENTTYQLLVTDASGCTATDSVRALIINDVLLLPTGFSPNSDGVNDLFRAANKNLKKLVLQVYNRWGEKVFESVGPKDGWDGFYKNSEQAIGTYTWRAEYQTTNMKKAKFESGNVTLIR